MIKSILWILIVNVLLFITSVFLFGAIAFLSGYASNGNYESATWRLFGAFVIVHLVLNLLFISNPRKNQKSIVIGSSMYILILYGIVVYIYR
ncbi:hypothetical protein GCM10027049_14120 [Mucilaginibacter puniceus]